MECGGGDLFCLVQNNKEVFGFIFEKVGGQVSWILKDFGQFIIGMFGICFGVWRWWRHHEKALHIRLAKYLDENDQRLIEGQSYILGALNRPRPGQPGKLPLFASPQLRRVFKRYNWDGTVFATGIEPSVSKQLEEAQGWVERRLSAAERSSQTLKQQLATVHLLRGALAASDLDSQMEALSSFRAVTQMPGQEGNLVAKELEAHTLRKLGRFDDAFTAYSEMEALASAGAMDRQQWLSVAKAKRYQAEMIQAAAASVDANGTIAFRATNAANLVSPKIEESALTIRARFAPFEDWEQIDQADLHYFTAFLANICQYTKMEPEQLQKAQDAYDDILFGRTRRKLPLRMGRLLREAEAGRDRVRAAKNGNYDTRWLFPGLKHPAQNEANSLSGGDSVSSVGFWPATAAP